MPSPSDDSSVATSNRDKPDSSKGGSASTFTCLVGIGASAGGLAALETLFEQVPPDTGAAFVVIQHLSPDYRSHMPELLSRRTKMPTVQISERIVPDPNTIYLLPPDRHVEFDGTHLQLLGRNHDSELNLPINRFFHSLANHDSTRIASVVLSGTGSDGSEGIQRVARAGGLVLCQDEDSAQFNGMPLNAIKTEAVHLVAPVPEIAEALAEFAGGKSIDEVIDHSSLSIQRNDLKPIYELLNSSMGVDFGSYKSGTFVRRLTRRMMMRKTEDLPSYLDLLQNEPDEVTRLSDDLLIGVTRFFRDPDGYQSLRNRVIRPGMENKPPGSEFRVWVAGCATGQEAYSIALALHDERHQSNAEVAIKVFATDVHPDAIRFAQQGIFPRESLNEIPKALRDKYVVPRGDGFSFTDKVRNSIVFAKHDVLRDAPFVHLDLLTCRNMLIYLLEDAQRTVLSAFTHCLQNRGALWLGPSETPGEVEEAYTALDKHWRLFQKVRQSNLPLDLKLRSRSASMPRISLQPRSSRTPSSSLVLSYDRLMEMYAPPSILIDENLHPLQMFGVLDDYLVAPQGRLSGTIEDSITEAVKAPLAIALQRLKLKQSMRESERGLLNGVPIVVTATTFHHAAVSETHYLITFERQEGAKPPAKVVDQPTTPLADGEAKSALTTKRSDSSENNSDEYLQQERMRILEMELDFTRENLQATVEELETTNEELQSSNEELTSSNEELQSTNEELHSVNEELHSANAESERRVELLSAMTADLENVLKSSHVGIILLDSGLRVRRITDTAAKMLKVSDSDLQGQTLPPTARLLDSVDLVELVEGVNRTGRPIETETNDLSGDRILVRIAGYEAGQGIIVTLTNIQSVRETADKLRKLTSIVSDSTDAIIGVDLDGRLNTANRAANQLFNRNLEQVSVLHLSDLLSEKASTQCLQMLEQLASRGRVEAAEIAFTKEGAERTVLVRVTPVLDDQQNVVSAAITFYDITDVRAAEVQLRLRTRAIDAANNGVIIVDANESDMPIIYANQGFTDISGFGPNEVLGRNCRFLQGPATDADDIQTIRSAIARKEGCRVTVLNYRRNGSPFYNDLIISPVKDEGGNVTHFVGIQHDVTQAVEASQAVKQSEAEYRSTFETAAVGIAHVGMDGSWLRVNKKLCDIIGYSAEELQGKTFQDITHPDDIQSDLGKFAPLMLGQIDGYSMEKRYLHKDGHVVWINLTTSLRRSLSGGPEACIAIIEDITGKKLTEERLAESQSIISQVIENIEDAFLSFDDQGVVRVANHAAEKLASETNESIIGRSYHDVLQDEATAPLRTMLERVQKSQRTESIEYLAPRLNRWYDASAFPVKGGAALYMSDVTARKDTEAHLERARIAAEEASKAKSQFLTNMSHEIRSPMTAILGFCEIALRDLSDGNPVDPEHLETVIRNGRFLLRIINDILDLSKVEAGKLQVRKTRFSTLPLLTDIAELMRHWSESSRVPLTFEFPGSIPAQLESDRSRLEQILVNLIGNAIKFSPDGDVRVVTDYVDQQLRVRVIDTGIGISEANLSNLFQTFSQVHGPQMAGVEGTGLGLAISRRLARLLGGDIQVESVEGEGSTFTLYLPVGKLAEYQLTSATETDLEAKESQAAALSQLSGRVLVADDARDIRFVTKHFFSRAGAEVAEAVNGSEAVAKVRQADASGRPFCCILMDIQMPETDGREATRLIREAGITVPIIALSAGATAEEVTLAINAGCTEFASKPIDGADLVARVAKLTAK